MYNVQICCEFILEQLIRSLRSTIRVYGLCEREWLRQSEAVRITYTGPDIFTQCSMPDTLSLELIYEQLNSLNDPINIDE